MGTISVRLDPKTRKLLDRLARAEKVSRSELVRRGIHLVEKQRNSDIEVRPYELIKHLVGKVHGGPPDLSERTGEKFQQLLLEKKKQRDSR